MDDIYDNGFSNSNVYGHIAALLARFQPREGDLFLDFGCGFGRLAEVVTRRHGLRYIGFDINQPGLASLRERGFTAIDLDLGDVDAAHATVLASLPKDARVAAVCTIDTLEHLPNPVLALELFGRIARERQAPLLVSVPNVAHLDIGAKLVVGRFDYTDAGLLDHTHMQYFTSERFNTLMESAGWHEVSRNDVELQQSDQHFPQQLPVLASRAPLAQMLDELRTRADPFGRVNQFVRAYLPGPLLTPPRHVPYEAQRESEGVPFLSVVIRTVGKRIGTLRESLLSLSAQTCQDFEVLVVGHNLDVERQIAVEGVIEELHEDVRRRVRLVVVDGGGRSAPLNAGFTQANGRYVAAFDDDDLLFGDWVECFAKLEKSASGQLLRASAIAQDWDRVPRPSGLASRAISGMRALYPSSFDLIAHVVENRTPLHSIAFPRALFSELGYRFDDELSTAEDWDLIIRVAPLCGVACSSTITAMYRLWKDGDSSSSHHDQFEWKSNYIKTLRKLNNQPLLLPPGSATRLRKMYMDLERLQAGVDMGGHEVGLDLADLEDHVRVRQLRDRYHELLQSRTWQLSSPVRVFMHVVRRRPLPRQPRIWEMSERELEVAITSLVSSRSWRLASSLKSLIGR